MQKSKTFLDLLAPTNLGVLAYFLIALIAFFAQDYYLRQHISSIYESSGFEGGIISHINNWFVNIIGSTRLNLVVVGIFWAIVGVGIYLVAHAIVENLSEFADDLSVRKYIWPQNSNRNSPLAEFFKKSLFRLAIIIVGCVYIVLVMRYLLERSLPNIYDLSTLSAHTIVVSVLWIVVYMIALHILTVILRLVFLRRRLFSPHEFA